MKRPRLTYIVFWIRFVIVTSISWIVYFLLIGLIDTALIERVIDIERSILGLSFKWIMVWIVLLPLFWWRAAKVFVLQGIPLLLGMLGSDGLEFKTSGRPMHMTWIGDLGKATVPFLFGAIFRSHQNSDKRFRSRLELLIITLPFGQTFIVDQGTFFLKFDYSSDQRHTYFVKRWAKYNPSSNDRQLEKISKDIEKISRVITENLPNIGI